MTSRFFYSFQLQETQHRIGIAGVLAENARVNDLAPEKIRETGCDLRWFSLYPHWYKRSRFLVVHSLSVYNNRQGCSALLLSSPLLSSLSLTVNRSVRSHLRFTLLLPGRHVPHRAVRQWTPRLSLTRTGVTSTKLVLRLTVTRVRDFSSWYYHLCIHFINRQRMGL